MNSRLSKSMTINTETPPGQLTDCFTIKECTSCTANNNLPLLMKAPSCVSGQIIQTLAYATTYAGPLIMGMFNILQLTYFMYIPVNMTIIGSAKCLRMSLPEATFPVFGEGILRHPHCASPLLSCCSSEHLGVWRLILIWLPLWVKQVTVAFFWTGPWKSSQSPSSSDRSSQYPCMTRTLPSSFWDTKCKHKWCKNIFLHCLPML